MSPLDVMIDVFNFYPSSEKIFEYGGSVTSISQSSVEISGLAAKVRIGDLVRIGQRVRGEVVQINSDIIRVFPFEDIAYIKVGDYVFSDVTARNLPTENWLGRVFDALGNPIDGGALPTQVAIVSDGKAKKKTGVLQRSRVQEHLKTGVKIIDIFTPICEGQRLGVFAGSGVGKSTLLSMLTRSDSFDVVVVSLVGERGREVREFLEDSIGPEGLKKTVAIVATSDESPMLRKRAPELAMDVCEVFSQAGEKVLFLVDSLTRYAHSLREIGIANGEPPVSRGYPASVFNKLPKLLERAGPGSVEEGSITMIATVLIDGDDHNDPIADAVRGVIDGHLVLDRSIAEQGRYPPINPLSSISRLSNMVWKPDERGLVLQLKKMISKFEDTRDLRMLGGWTRGADDELDKAVETVPIIYEALCQSLDTPFVEDAFQDLVFELKKAQQKSN